MIRSTLRRVARAVVSRVRASLSSGNPPVRTPDEFDQELPRPALVYEHEGVGYTRSPDHLEAWAVDEGQFDLIKLDMRAALWRYQHKLTAPCMMDAYAAGVAYRPETRSYGPLFPVSPDLAEGSRRLGYARLVAATGLTVSADTEASFWSDNEETVRAVAIERHAKNAATAEKWPVHMGKFAYDTEAQIIASLTLGDPDGPTLPAGKVAEPLKVFAFDRQATAPGFSPATATNAAPSGPGARP
jgi:hypothetical protein